MNQTDGRIRLANLLAEAAEIEHNLICQYLFAAFSMKRTHDEGGISWQQLELNRRWESGLTKIARQEMEHLGLVCNLLTAIGEAPNLHRPQFPASAQALGIDAPFELLPFGEEFLRRALRYECPQDMSPDTRRRYTRAVGAPPHAVNSIAALYAQIKELFCALDEAPLFLGPPSAQLTNREILPIPVVGVSPFGGAIYDVQVVAVRDSASAKAAVDQILREGEGAGDDVAGSHFGEFLTTHEQLVAQRATDPRFEPARPVVHNPRTAGEIAKRPGTREITNKATNRVSELFDLTYETMLLMLIRYYVQADANQAQLNALQAAAFFPLMTTGIRPLGEILTLLPATDDPDGPRAGPTFRMSRRLTFLPHRRAAWVVIQQQLARVHDLAASLAADSAAYPSAVRERLLVFAQNAERMTFNFEQQMNSRQP